MNLSYGRLVLLLQSKQLQHVRSHEYNSGLNFVIKIKI